MIEATARVLQNVIEVRVGPEPWVAKPVISGSNPIGRALSAMFSTTYQTFRATEPDQVHSTVTYFPKKDEIVIQVGEERWQTKSSVFGPMLFEYGGVEYAIREKLTGRFGVFRAEKLVAAGELGFRTCQLRDYPDGMEGFLGQLMVGYLIRTLFWQI
jgi:hypothetical protein